MKHRIYDKMSVEWPLIGLFPLIEVLKQAFNDPLNPLYPRDPRLANLRKQFPFTVEVTQRAQMFQPTIDPKCEPLRP